MQGIIHLENIRKNYYLGKQTIEVLKGITFDIFKNEYVALMGPSGSGKSTLMNILGCLDSPSSGRYILNGEVSKNFLTICLKKGGRWNNLHQSVLSLKPPNSLNRRTLTCYPLIINSICLHAGTNSYSSNRLVIGSIIQDICIG